MAPIVDNNQFELLPPPPAVETPGKKRKRNAETNPFLSFSDQTFSIPSSTPIHNKQIDGSAFENPSFRYNSSNKENYNIFSESCMEVKSIAELASVAGENPYEVIRKPPKKKKKQSDFEDSCFVNPGLNLAAIDKPSVNPFEVVRSEEPERKGNDSCFVNGALNIKGRDKGEGINPFEILRPTAAVEAAVRESSSADGLKGIENPALEMPTYALAVPFTPSINHRINFQELSPSALTPCQMLTKNLVFSPDPTKDSNLITPKRNAIVTKRKSLSVINEEPLDIGEELDCYQLELENSINEAKALKQKTVGDSTGGRKSRRSLIDVKHISNLSMKLEQLEESDGEGEEREVTESVEPKTEETTNITEITTPAQATFTVVKETSIREEIRINVTNPDVQFEEVDDFEDEEQDVDLFANPAPFQRAYRKKEDPKPQPEADFKQPEPVSAGLKSHKFKETIRRSFRKLMHPKHQELEVECHEKPKPEEPHSGGLMSTIRHSLRRKTHKGKAEEEEDRQNDEAVLEMSIIVETPRTVFKQPSNDGYKPIAGGSVDKMGSTLRSSLRRSTKDMKKHVMKSVFKQKVGDEK
ncbi:uncharacterized protein LOC131685522 [Topomyia yanbarensis]|uniref:uncharacterized protein LOC131685522 n=1 Tax=Topomyia yanbarensis TaxID=2498891 RepID=UPI00273C0259|nr:uncharacterized protein LOC131685522 [Topomyia yanbarensis]